jgi:anti-anti-sigma factor
MNSNFLAESKLKNTSPELHKRYTRYMASAGEHLGKYLNIFPEFTDHSLLHSMEVANLANRLIANRIDKLCAVELYILLMAALLHDVGMGYGAADLEKQRPAGYDEYRKTHSREDIHAFVRKNHHDLGAMFIMDNWESCLIPDEQTAAAIAEVGRGHRKTDLTDTVLYPTDLKIGSSTVNMPYLASAIRLADEMDISASRNLRLMFSGFVPTTDIEASAFQSHRLLKSEFIGEIFILEAETGNINEYNELTGIYRKVSETLDYCQKVVQSCAGVNLPVRMVENRIRLIENTARLILDDSRSGDTLTIALKGKLDASTYSLLDERLSNSIGGTVINLVLDCAELIFVASAGLRVLLGAKMKTSEIKGEMTLINVSDDVIEVLEMTGFTDILTIV